MKTTRRQFLHYVAATGVGYWAGTSLAPRALSANDKLNVAFIGAGGQGGSNLNNIARLGENIVALCDVDEERARDAFNRFPQAKKYNDFRKMLEEMGKSIDAVVVSTPDHTHAVAAVTAMKMGKHVYCEKPLTHSVYEARVMRETAARMKVATQMGNQGTSFEGLRRGVEAVQDGIVGPIREVHVWTNRPIWPQGIDRPKDTPPVPATLHWDLWLGPAPERPYHPAYVPFRWRGWWDFGTGALGDMGCHTANLPYMALKLTAPVAIEAEASAFNNETYPTWAIVRYEFPERNGMPPVRLTWYEGSRNGKRVLPPNELFQGQKVSDSGCLMVGERGTLFSPDDYGARIFLLKDGHSQELTGSLKKLPRSPVHHAKWVQACKGGPKAMSNFDYAGPLTEFILLGNVAIRAKMRLEWDAENLKVKNCPDAEAYVRREYRRGWTL